MNGRIFFCYSLLALIFSLLIVNDSTNNLQKTRAMMATRALGESLTEALQLNEWSPPLLDRRQVPPWT